MSLTFTRTFNIRLYECDAYGHLNNANYLRFMQETAFDATAAAGYSLARYAQMERVWLVRNTQIEYLQPLAYQDQVELRTWVSDFRRASSRRNYEFWLPAKNILAARAFTDWVFVNTTNGELASVPAEAIAAFFPEGVPDSYPSRQAFPTAPPPPQGVFRLHRRVAWHDIDNLQHVNNAVYLEYIEECGFQAVAAHHWPYQRMLSEGFAILLRQHQIQYLQPAVLDDELEIDTWVSDVRRSTAMRHYTIRRVSDNALLLRAHTLGVWVNLQTGRPMRIPPQLLEDFSPNIAQPASASGASIR